MNFPEICLRCNGGWVFNMGGQVEHGTESVNVSHTFKTANEKHFGKQQGSTLCGLLHYMIII